MIQTSKTIAIAYLSKPTSQQTQAIISESGHATHSSLSRYTLKLKLSQDSPFSPCRGDTGELVSEVKSTFPGRMLAALQRLQARLPSDNATSVVGKERQLLVVRLLHF